MVHGKTDIWVCRELITWLEPLPGDHLAGWHKLVGQGGNTILIADRHKDARRPVTCPTQGGFDHLRLTRHLPADKYITSTGQVFEP